MNALALRASRVTWVAGLVLAGLLSGCVVAPARPHYRAAPPPPPPPVAAAPAMYFYPELNQDEARQDRDRYECYRWAVRQSGVDPGMTPVRQAPYPRAAVRDGSEVAGGAVAGAVVGAAVSGPRHMGENAVLGAIFGATLGAIAQESRVQHAEQAYAARQQAAMQPNEDFRRAMGACMSGRGYRVG